MKEYDVFISYARKDKDKLVDELHEQFKKLNVKIFYDAESLEWGDDWKSKISNAINSCKYGVVIISNNYFGREWTEKELNELLRQKNENKDVMILPILYNTTLKSLVKNYKQLADIQFITTKECDAKDITILLARRLLSDIKTNLDNSEELSKYDLIKLYCEKTMCSSLEFFNWIQSLIENNNFKEPYSDNWIGWYTFKYNNKNIPLFQHMNGLYRINPTYLDDFRKYYEEEVIPQL